MFIFLQIVKLTIVLLILICLLYGKYIFLSLHTVSEILYLKINFDKTKYVHFTRQHCLQDNRLNNEGQNFEQVKQFRCLGVITSNKNTEEPAIKNRISLANRYMEQGLTLKDIIL